MAVIERVWRMLSGGRVLYAVLACYLLVLGFLSLNPWLRPVTRPGMLSPDKFDHALAYGGLAVILYAVLRIRLLRHGPQAWLAALLGASAIGVLVEIAQTLFTTNRTGSIEDAVANVIGAAFGLVAYRIVSLLLRSVRSSS